MPPVDITESLAQDASNEVGSAGEDDQDRDSYYSELDPLNLRHGTLIDLAREWVMKQLGRNCSNMVADQLFDFAWEYCDVFMRLKQEHPGKRNLLPNLRKKLVKQLAPGLKMDFVFHDLTHPTVDGEVPDIQVNDLEKFPKKKYPQDKYELVSQVTRMKVKMFDIKILTNMTLKLSFV